MSVRFSERLTTCEHPGLCFVRPFVPISLSSFLFVFILPSFLTVLFPPFRFPLFLPVSSLSFLLDSSLFSFSFYFSYSIFFPSFFLPVFLLSFLFVCLSSFIPSRLVFLPPPFLLVLELSFFLLSRLPVFIPSCLSSFSSFCDLMSTFSHSVYIPSFPPSFLLACLRAAFFNSKEIFEENLKTYLFSEN